MVPAVPSHEYSPRKRRRRIEDTLALMSPQPASPRPRCLSTASGSPLARHPLDRLALERRTPSSSPPLSSIWQKRR